MIIPIIAFRDYWNELRFWITVVILGVLQVPLVIAVEPSMEQFRFPFMFTFMILDGLAVIILISRVCSIDLRKRK